MKCHFVFLLLSVAVGFTYQVNNTTPDPTNVASNIQNDLPVSNNSLVSKDDENVARTKLSSFETRFESLERKFFSYLESVETRFEALENRIITYLETVENRASYNSPLAGDAFINSNGTSKLNDTNTRTLQLKECTKGTVPYAIITPSVGDTLDSPFVCEIAKDGGGWIVIQRRSNGYVDFYRGWEEYKQGFGSLDGDFWMGNEQIHRLTNSGHYELRVDLVYDKEKYIRYAHYDDFYLDGERGKYAIHVKGYSGTADDSLIDNHDGMKFSTFDSDNDLSSENCAELWTGAWWYNNCHYSNLNGRWMAGMGYGPRWGSLTAAGPCSFTEMKVRRVK